jgi:hypothetical protein
MRASPEKVLPFNLNDTIETKREKTETETGTESLDLKTEIQLSYTQDNAVKRFLGFVYEGFMPVAGGIEIDDIRDEGWGWPLLTIYLLLFSFVFVYLTVTGTIENYKTNFLSLLGSSSSGSECVEVPLSLTAKYLGDTHGRWETEKQFNYNSSIFVIDFLGAAVNTKQYSDTILGFRKHLESLGAKSMSRNVAWTSLAWSTLSYTNVDKTIRFYSNADVGIMVGGEVSAYWSNRNGLCKANTSTVGSFSPTTKMFSLTALYQGDPCESQNGALLRAVSTYSDLVQIDVDARSLQTAIALNFGIVNLTRLIVTRTSYGDIANLFYPGAFYVDPHFSSMQPIFCLDKSHPTYNLSSAAIKGPEICYIAYGGNGIGVLFGYPMVQEFKKSIKAYVNKPNAFGDTGYQNTCKCPTDKFDEQCNAMEAVYTVIYSTPLPYSEIDDDSLWPWIDMFSIGVRAQKLMLKDPVNGDKAMMELFSPITAYSLMAASNSTPYSNESLVSYTKMVEGSPVHYDYSFANGKSFRRLMEDAWDDVCPSRKCAAAIFSTKGRSLYQLFSPMNIYNSQLSSLSTETHYSKYVKYNISVSMCHDTFSQKIAFDSFLVRPPVQLVQPYLQCHSTLQKAFIAAVGNANSNATLCCTIVIAILGILVVRYINHHKSIKRDGQVADKLITTKMKGYVTEKSSEKKFTDLVETIETMNTSMNKMVKDMRVLKKRVVIASNPNHDSGTIDEEGEECV